ncbi:MAG: hypothetical protein ACW98Y_13105 [Candidatus Thorarchaeota archaeon]|jgi:hypothetical protein
MYEEIYLGIIRKSMRAMRDADKESELGDTDPDALGAFYVIGGKPSEVISGWIALDEGIDEFLETIFEEMEYTLQIEVKDQHMYDLYYVDSKKENTLTVVPDQQGFENVKQLEQIKVMVLHKDINKSDVENHPRFKDWLEESE